MQISYLVGKTVLSRSGEWLGYVVALYLTRDMKKLSCLVCADAEEEEFYLPARAVLSTGDAVIAGRRRLASPTGVPCPVGRPVYAHTGEFCGVIADMVPCYAPMLVLAGEGERRVPLSLAAVGETVILYPDAQSRRRGAGGRTGSAHRARRTPSSLHARETGDTVPARDTSAWEEDRTLAAPEEPLKEQPAAKEEDLQGKSAAEANAQAQVVAEENVQAQPAEEENEQVQPAAQKGHAVRLDRANLLGRRVRRSVYDARGGVVALAGERITPEVLSRARRENRLLALTVNTLTNLI